MVWRGLLVATFLSLLTLLEGRRGSMALTTTNNSRRHASKGEQFEKCAIIVKSFRVRPAKFKCSISKGTILSEMMLIIDLLFDMTDVTLVSENTH